MVNVPLAEYYAASHFPLPSFHNMCADQSADVPEQFMAGVTSQFLDTAYTDCSFDHP